MKPVFHKSWPGLPALGHDSEFKRACTMYHSTMYLATAPSSKEIKIKGHGGVNSSKSVRGSGRHKLAALTDITVNLPRKNYTKRRPLQNTRQLAKVAKATSGRVLVNYPPSYSYSLICHFTQHRIMHACPFLYFSIIRNS